MLNTLLKIGEWQKQKLSKWDRILDKPKVRWESRGKPVTNYVVALVFDLDEHDIYPKLVKEYDEDKDPEHFKTVKVQGGRNKSVYAATGPRKLKQIFKAYFGRLKDNNAEYGQIIEAIDKDFPEFQGNKLYKLIKDLFPLKEIFINKSTIEGQTKFKNILNSIELGAYEKIALVYAAIKSKKYGFYEPYPIAQIDKYEDFLSAKFLDSSDAKSGKGLCYASGEIKNDVAELDLSTRYSLNKMFVTSTKNYAHLFNKNSFSNNYQISRQNQISLDLASNYLLKNYTTRIADIDHVIIPEFRKSSKPDLALILDKIKTNSDLLFTLAPLDEVRKDLELEVEEVYWLNFLAFESDGNFFKTLTIIKDVSKFHFQNVLEAFHQTDINFEELNQIVDWQSVLTRYGDISKFNLYTIYGLIPIRKDKEKKNVALQLFKSILENRQIEKEQIFQFFSELILCHYYGRYNSYTNVNDYSQKGNRSRQEYFIWAVRDSVFKYLAFIHVLKKLNLIDMEQEEKTVSAHKSNNDFHENIQNFFVRMDYNNSQKAMFFLGRMLNAVTYLQKDKNKTVIDKINYNGMDRDDIIRLRVDLFEKAKQYGKPEKVKFKDSHFGQHFNFEQWNMNPQEAVFFILTGYSFGLVKQQDTNSKNN